MACGCRLSGGSVLVCELGGCRQAELVVGWYFADGHERYERLWTFVCTSTMEKDFGVDRKGPARRIKVQKHLSIWA